MVEVRVCPDCGAKLTGLIYGYSDCGPHTVDEFEAHIGYKFDVGDGLFADWDNGPQTILLLASSVPSDTHTIYTTAERCCGRLDIEPDEYDYCPECRDVMDVPEEE